VPVIDAVTVSVTVRVCEPPLCSVTLNDFTPLVRVPLAGRVAGEAVLVHVIVPA
jgi:hypothetical protein